jgi:hypothetical protein
MNFGDVLKGIGMTILHLAEKAATDPTLQQALVAILVTAVQAEAAKKSS